MNDSKDDFYTLFSFCYSNLPIIRSLLRKCRLHPYSPFYPLVPSSFFQVPKTNSILSVLLFRVSISF